MAPLNWKEPYKCVGMSGEQSAPSSIEPPLIWSAQNWGFPEMVKHVNNNNVMYAASYMY